MKERSELLMLGQIRSYFAGSPVRIRAVLVAVLGFLAPYAPVMAEFKGSETVVGGFVAAIALALGESAQRKENAKTEAAAARKE